MKSYDQALNEIYQKAQARSEQIKKRNKIVLAILPAFCVIALTIAMIFLATPPATSDPGSDLVAPPNDSLQSENPKDDPDKEEVVQPPEKNPDEDIKDEEGTDVPPNESGDDPNQDDPNQDNPSQDDPGQNNPGPNDPNQDDPNHGNTGKDDPDQEDPLPPVVEYLEVTPGKYLYFGNAMMGVGGNNGGVAYALKGVEELGLIDRFPKTQKVVYEELKGTRVFNMLGKDVVIEYIFSYECVGEVGDEVKKYENVHVYRGEGNSSYQFSAVTGQLVRYYNPQGEDNADGETDPEIVHKRFIESQLGEGILDSYERHFTANNRGYDYTFSKKIAGFNTTERISVGINFHGELTFYLIQHLGAYDQYIDNVSTEDIAYTVDVVSDTLYLAGVKMGSYAGTEFVLDANGVLYVAVSYANGRTYYSEILDADDANVIKYVTNSNGSFIYSDCGVLDADNERQETLYFVSANEIPFVLGYGPETLQEALAELEGEREFSFGDKVIRLQYQYSDRIADGSSGLVARYINTDYYRDESGQFYRVSSYTGEIFHRYYNVNEGVPRGTLSADGAVEAAVAFLNAHLDGFDLSQYRIYVPNLDYASDGAGYYRLELTRQLHGFDTNETIIMSIAGTGEVMTYIHKLPHLYDGVEDSVSKEDVENAVWDLRSTLLLVRACGIDMNTITILTDDEGKLYVRAVGRNGYLYYNEIVLKN